MDFNTAIQYVLRYEGGLVDDPKDTGGITKYGISLRAYPALGRDGIVNLTVDAAKKIYKSDYWNLMHCDELPPYLRLMALDCAVNQGVGYSSKALQGSVGAYPDGVLGPKTLAAVKAADPEDALHKYTVQRLLRYSEHPQWVRYKSGWVDRLIHVTIACTGDL